MSAGSSRPSLWCLPHLTAPTPHSALLRPASTHPALSRLAASGRKRGLGFRPPLPLPSSASLPFSSILLPPRSPPSSVGPATPAPSPPPPPSPPLPRGSGCPRLSHRRGRCPESWRAGQICTKELSRSRVYSSLTLEVMVASQDLSLGVGVEYRTRSVQVVPGRCLGEAQPQTSILKIFIQVCLD
nr:protein enabled homolog [Globicephala melas]